MVFCFILQITSDRALFWVFCFILQTTADGALFWDGLFHTSDHSCSSIILLSFISSLRSNMLVHYYVFVCLIVQTTYASE